MWIIRMNYTVFVSKNKRRRAAIANLFRCKGSEVIHRHGKYIHAIFSKGANSSFGLKILTISTIQWNRICYHLVRSLIS